MGFNTVGKQWAFIVREFEGAVKAQKELMTEKNPTGFQFDEYEDGWLRALELGLTQAKGCRRAMKLHFWRKPVTRKETLLVGFLLRLRMQVAEEQLADTSYRSGMMDACQSWADDLVNDPRFGMK
jgi:hypothetical protein